MAINLERFISNACCNSCQSFYDMYVEANVRFRSALGMKAIIIRRQLGHCCDWCAKLAGIYDPSDAPDDIYRRHSNCRCLVTFKSQDGYQDIWNKKIYQTQREARISRIGEAENSDIALTPQQKIYFIQEDDLSKPEYLDDDFSDCEAMELSDIEKQIFSQLHNLSVKNDYEYIAYYYQDGSVRYETSKEHGAVKIDDDLLDRNIKLYHSHTSDSPFSYVDILQLYREQVDEIGVICNNNDVFKISIGNGYLPSIEEMDSFLASIENDLIESLLRDDNFFDLSISERNYLYFKERLYRLVREFGWSYKGTKLQ